jgi:hypothetical protein
MTMTLIETKTLGTAAAAIEFTSIPQTYTDLYLVVSARWSNDLGSAGFRFNGSSTGYSWRRLVGNGSTASSGSGTANTGLAGDFVNNSDTANTFANNSLYIPNYTSSTTKSVSVDSVRENNATTSFQQIIANLWDNNAAITTITLLGYNNGTANIVAGSTVSLYGILKGSDGIVTTSP